MIEYVVLEDTNIIGRLWSYLEECSRKYEHPEGYECRIIDCTLKLIPNLKVVFAYGMEKELRGKGGELKISNPEEVLDCLLKQLVRSKPTYVGGGAHSKSIEHAKRLYEDRDCIKGIRDNNIKEVIEKRKLEERLCSSLSHLREIVDRELLLNMLRYMHKCNVEKCRVVFLTVDRGLRDTVRMFANLMGVSGCVSIPELNLSEIPSGDWLKDISCRFLDSIVECCG